MRTSQCVQCQLKYENKKGGKFCSFKCYNDYRNNLVTVRYRRQCVHCDAEFIPPNNNRQQKYCNNECFLAACDSTNELYADGRSRTQHRNNIRLKRNYQRWLAVQKLGGKCAACPETDYVVLQLDHINNDGNTERTQKGESREKMSRAIIAGERDDIQVLCANCHARKTIADKDGIEELFKFLETVNGPIN